MNKSCGTCAWFNKCKDKSDADKIKGCDKYTQRSMNPQLSPGQSVEEFCDAYQKANW